MQYKSKKIFILSIVMLFFMVGITIFNQTDKSEAMTIINNKIYDYSYKTMFTTIRGRGFWTYNSKGKKVFMDIEYQDSITNVVFDQYALSGWVHIGSDDYFLTPTDKTKTLATGIFHVQDENKNMTRFGFSYDGKLLHGLHIIDDNYYFMDNKGIVQTNTWKTVNNKYYYFNKNGIAYKSTNKTINKKEYYFNSYAQLITGLFTDNTGNKKYGTYKYGILKNSWEKINGYWYYFDTNGNAVNGNNIKTNEHIYNFKDYKLQTGLQKIDGEYLYVENNHKYALKSWKKINGYWYYFCEDYFAYENGDYKIDGVYYKFKNYKVQTGIQLVNKKYHYYNPKNAVMSKDRWIKSGNYWWYFDKNGNAVNGVQNIKGYYYVFKSYQLQTGLQILNITSNTQPYKYNEIYYCDANGKAANGWTKLGSDWYYFVKGKGYIDEHKIGDDYYFFNSKGVMQTGFIYTYHNSADLHLCYFAPNGKLITKQGWHKWNNKWYYIVNNTGRLLVNTTKTINNKEYTFDKKGVCLNP